MTTFPFGDNLTDHAKRENERRVRALLENAENVKEHMNNLNAAGLELNAKIKRTNEQLKNLDSQAGKRLSMLDRVNKDTARAWEWVQENQHEFEKPILGPPIVECSVENPKYVDMIESLLQPGDMITLTAQTKDDQKKLHGIIKNKLKCSRTNTRCALPMSRYTAPIGTAQREALGLEGWALDYLKGPEPVLAMLCEAAAIHRTGVTLEDTSAERFEQLQNSNLSQWVTSRSVYRVMRRREYGPSAVSTTVRELRRAQFWTNQPVDFTLKRELGQRIAQWEEESEDARKQYEALKSGLEDSRRKKEELKEEQEQLKEEKANKQKAAQNFKALPVRIAQQEERRRERQAVLDGVRQKLEEIESKQGEIKLDKARAALAYAESVGALQRAYEVFQEAEIMLIEAQSDAQVLEQNNTQIKNQLEGKRAEVEELSKTMHRAKADARKAQGMVTSLRENADRHFAAFLDSYDAHQTMEQLEDEIESERSRLELSHEGDSNVIVQFEERERKIEKLREKLGRVNEALQEIGDKIGEVRRQWEPQLDELIKRISSSFSYNMAQISCNGEVEVHKDEDYDLWAIIIYVRFR